MNCNNRSRLFVFSCVVIKCDLMPISHFRDILRLKRKGRNSKAGFAESR